jgi:hypothetical protein
MENGCMKIIKRIAIRNRKGVWKPKNASGEYLNGVTVTTLWNGVNGELIPYLQNVTKCKGKADFYHKSKPLCIIWRTVLRKLIKNGLKVTV